MTTNTVSAPARSGRARAITLWTAQGLLAAFFAFAAVPKLLGDPTTTEMMAKMGSGAWLGYFIGACELAGAIGLLVPRLTGLAATGLALLMVGATISNLGPLDFASAAPTTAVLAVVFAAIAWARRESIRNLLKR
ncbi:MAG: DoxX family protein [Stackebrandtia sp.]